MNVVFKKYNFVVIGLTVLFASSQVVAQDLFDDSFLSDPENKSISVSSEDKMVVENAPAEAVVPKVNSAETAMPEIVFDEKVVSESEVVIPVSEAMPMEDNLADNQINIATPALKTPNASVAKADAIDPVVDISSPEEKVNIIEDDNVGEKTPSEKVIGSISREMFQEMAELEKENSLLNLQLKQEKLKNEINDVKAMQRQSLMNEIAKREMAARSRIEWELEQELREIEVWEKRQKADLLAKQIEGIVSGASEDKAIGGSSYSSISSAIDPNASNAAETYYILEVRGLGDDLVAKVVDSKEKQVFLVKKDSVLPSGHKVLQINKDHVKLTQNGRDEMIGFSIKQQ